MFDLDTDWCRCGHPLDWHRHLRDGDDCGRCPREICATFRNQLPLWRRWLRWLAGPDTAGGTT